jgi:integrase/recombinase XerD
MFEKLFVKYRAITRHQNSPMAKERLEYLEYCAKQGMSVSSLKEIATYLLIVVEFLHLDTTENEAVSVDDILKQAEQWANREPQPSSLKSLSASKKRFIKHATCWLQFMGRLLTPVKETSPYECYLSPFVDFMKTEKELSLSSIDVRYRSVRDFLAQLYKNGNVLKAITITHIDEILIRKTIEDNYATSTLQCYACNLRGFIRFAESRDWCAKGLAEMIETPRVYKHSNIPSGPSWEDVQKLIASTEGDNPTGL